MTDTTSKDKMLEINKEQQAFYNDIQKGKNRATRVWAYFRETVLKSFRKGWNTDARIYELHKEWFGDLAGKKVLDLGVFHGNFLSMYLAENSEEYVAIDLSQPGIKRVKEKLAALGKPNTSATVVDFLSDDFKHRDFDVIYAMGVLHHFGDPNELVKRIKQVLKPGGIMVSYDPLQTSLPIKFLRTIYRPFQSDSKWEWPFTRKTIRMFKKEFDVLERKGVFGKSKWAILMRLLPFSKSYKERKAQEWVEHDWNKASTSDSALFACMHVSLLMRNPANK
ncbi:MAG: class I SAM-dependent methyltransferase [Bacteroidota bacterium]